MTGRSTLVLALAAALAAVLADTSPAGAAGNRWVRADPLLIAHQGGEDEFPSNTLYAYRRALRGRRPDWPELDIGVTKDGHVVVMHDTTVEQDHERGAAPSRPRLSRQIKRLDAAYWFSRRGPDHLQARPPGEAPTAVAASPPASAAPPKGHKR